MKWYLVKVMSNPRSAPHFVQQLSAQVPNIPQTSFINNNSSHVIPLCSVFCVVAVVFVFLFILNMSELAEAQITALHRTGVQMCAFVWTRVYVRIVLRHIGPYSVHGCILNLDVVIGRDVQETGMRKTIGALKTYF